MANTPVLALSSSSSWSGPELSPALGPEDDDEDEDDDDYSRWGLA